MESNPLPPSPTDAAEARNALLLVAEARGRAAARVTAPWWLHVGLGIVFAFAFASMSVRGIIGSCGFPSAMVAALGLFHAVRVQTGLSVDRYTATPGTRRLSLIWILLTISISGTAMVLEWGMNIRWSLAVAGAVIGFLTIVMGPAVDRALRRDAGAY